MKHFYIALFFIVSFFTTGFAQNEFITTWETTTADESITIPTTGSGYNYTVDWGDGTIETGFTGNATHEYAVADIYTVKITGDFPRIYFNNNADSDKILTVEQWGNIAWTSMENAFNDCKKLRIKATDAPDLSRVTNLRNAFRACQAFRDEDFSNWDVSNVTNMPFVFFASSFNGDVSTWDVGSVTNFISTFAISPFNQNISSWNIGERVTGTINMGGMFLRGRQFNQNLGSWDISKVSNMNNMFSQSALSTTNYDATLIGWARQDPGETIPSNISISFEGSQYCLGADARNTLTDPTGLNWSITDDGIACDATDFFITTWETTANNENITIPTTGSGYNYTVDWGDGTAITSETGNALHEYATAGNYSVRIIGDFPRIYFNDSGDKDKILNVTQWGSIAWNGFNDAFSGCSNLDVIATDAPDLSNVTSVSRMFRECTTLGTSSMLDFSNWDTSSVVVFGGMFRNASNFNSTSITNWDVGKATGFVLMFENAITFNQDISNWNIGENVTGTVNLGSMLIGAENFDQNLGAWNLEKVTNIRNMLNDTGLSTANYDATLIGWAENSNTPSGLDLGASSLTYCLGEAARNILTDTNGLNWTISDGGLGCAVTDFFATTWRTTSSERRITIPTTGGGYNYSVDWGDGTIETGFTGNASHSYATAGIHTVRIIGDFPRIYFYVAPSNDNILSIEQWGTISWTSMREAFATCQNLVLNADDVPDLSLVEDLSLMFLGASTFVDNKDKMNSWDISNVRNLERMFESAASFNEPLHNWDTSNVENMDYMFYVASSFDQSLGDWNLSNVFSLLNILSFSDISSENYDATLIGWAEQSPGDTIRPRRGLGTIRTSYCLGTDARRILTSAPHNWSITDQGQNCDFTNAFVTTWQTTTADEDITIPTTGAGYNYIVDWGDGTTITSETGNATHTYTSAGAYEVKIIGDFPRIYINGNSAARDKIIAVDQWGTQQWTSMENAFTRCSLLVINATDSPDLSLAKSMKKMFEMTSSLVDHGGNMGNWDVSTIEDMREVFDSSNFNENISTWNVSAVKDFSSMFFRNTSFNQNLDSWNTSAGELFSNMFRDATAFNEAIGSWNTEQATSLSNMFNGATAFNQDISAWDVKNVRNINNAFDGATAFDQDLGSWDISSLVENTNSIQHMFSNSGMSTTNYDNTLIGWARLDAGETKIPVGVIFDAENVSYCLGEAARTILTSAPYNWIITDGGKVCPEDAFITSWLLEDNDRITIRTSVGYNYNYTIDWGDGTKDTNVTTDISHDYTTAGTYEVSITGEFPRFTLFFRFGRTLRTKIQTIEQWGNIQWRSFRDSFNDCENLKLNADDTPDLSQVTELSRMFQNCTNFEDLKDTMGSWDVSTIESIDNMFDGCSIFNEDIGAWTFTNLLTADAAFQEAVTFNQNISSWNMATVTDMENMFYNATAFNQPVGNWTLGMVEDMNRMFAGATNFNQDVSSWDFSQVQDIEELFSGASSFDQDLSSWDISSVTDMTGIFTGTAMSQENYDKTLIGWATLETEETKIPANVTLDADVAHCLSVDAVNTLTSASYNWTINDLGNSCPGDAFVITWSVGAGESIIIPVDSGLSYDYTIDWGDDAVSRNQTGEVTHTYIDAGTYTVSIIGEFPAIRFSRATGAIRDRLRTVEQWGTQQWVTIESAFVNCKNLKLNADDVPNLSRVSDMGDMFSGCINFEDLKDKMGSWDMSTITDISYMFTECADFNEDISGWTFNNLEYTFVTFEGNLKFNQDISNWDMSNVKDMSYMFEDAISFNQPVGNWTLGSVESMEGLFHGATTFNQDLSNWDFSHVYDATDLFKNASSFNQDLSTWDISNVSDMEDFFIGTAMSTENYDKTLIGWATLEAGENAIPADLTLNADTTYCLAEAARNTLTSAPYNWTINDGGQGCLTPVITLLGDNPQIIEQGGSYTEFGAEVTYGAILTIDAISVNTNQVGNYTVTYDAINNVSGATAVQITRTVNVVDTTLPVITLTGDNPQTIELGAGYTELGATTDDGSNVVIDTSDFIDAVGSYTIRYNTADASGNVATEVTRIVNVVDTTSPVITLTGDNPQTIELGDGYTELGATTDDGSNIVIDTSDFVDAVGSYTIRYNATDASGNDAIEVTRTVNVVDTTLPVITLTGANPQTIELGDGYTEFGATTNDGITNVTSDASDFADAVGSYTIRYNATDVSGNVAVEVTRTVNVVDSCPIVSLPSNNFQIVSSGETCVDKDNGMITINAATDLDYVTTINGENYNFTSSLEVDNLSPGTYPVCIAIDGFTNCEQCFEVVIEEATTLVGKTVLNTDSATNKVFVAIDSGTAPYKVMINDEVVGEYDSNSFSVEVKNGDTVDVFSSLTCEGKLSTKVDLFDDITAYPNPTRVNVELTIPNTGSKTIVITIYNSLGIQVSSGVYKIANSRVLLPMKNLAGGVYFVQVNEVEAKMFKIVKE